MSKDFTWYEFFAGGGMARLGLGERWECVFANEWCAKKAAAYRAHFGKSEELVVKDVAHVQTSDLPGRADLAWASFPCQDLSLAGDYAGLKGKRSGTFWSYWNLMTALAKERRAPHIIVLENVTGALTSHQGGDFSAIVRAFAEIDYRVGCLVLDAVEFVPQSRPRLFVIGISSSIAIPKHLIAPAPSDPWHPKSLRTAVSLFPHGLDESLVWWRLPFPNEVVPPLAAMIEDEPTAVNWDSPSETKYLLSLMSPLHLRKIDAAGSVKTKTVGTVYKRTRSNEAGKRSQQAEVRFDNVAGCLRTPVGGSSRQTVIVVEGKRVRSRLLSPREAARLMGVPDDYPLPVRYNDAYHLFGDGVAVPVVAWLEKHLLRPLACLNKIAPITKQIA
jgi:DNA (cytosine-5)-methyltransferase 1